MIKIKNVERSKFMSSTSTEKILRNMNLTNLMITQKITRKQTLQLPMPRKLQPLQRQNLRKLTNF